MSRDALIVGISSYINLPSLAAPASDAEEMYQLLLQYGGFDSIKPLPLIYAAEGDGFAVGRTSRLSHDELKNALVELFMPQGDRHPEMALFYFSGHGQRHACGIREGYLAVSDSQASGGNMGISLDWLRRLLAASPVRKQVILLDCCYSGELLSLDEADPGDRGKGHDRCFIAASREYQLAYEQGSGQHGILTAALLKALDPHSYDSGWVNNHSLAARIREQWQSGIQSPLCTNSGEQIIITRSVAAAVSRQPEKSVLPEQIQEKVSPASMTPMLAPSSGSDDSLETRAETVYGELRPEEQGIAQRLFLTLMPLNEGSEAVCCQTSRESLLPAGMNEESVDRTIKALGDAGLIAIDNSPESGEAVIKMAQESLMICWPRLRGWLDEHRENIIFHRRLDAAARQWQEKKRNGKWLWDFSDLKQLKKFAEKHQQDMDDVQQAFFASSKNNAAAIYFFRVLFISLILCGIAASACYHFNDYLNEKIELRNKQHRILAQIHRNAKAAKDSADKREIHNLSFDVLQRAGNIALQLLPHDEDRETVSINMINEEMIPIARVVQISEGSRFLAFDFNSKASLRTFNSGAVKWNSEIENARNILFSHDGTKIITIKSCEYQKNYTTRIWNADIGMMIGKPMRHEECVYGGLFSNDDTKILTWSKDGTAKLWNAASGTMIGEQMRHEESIHGGLFSNDDTKVLTWSKDGTAKLWNAASGTMIGEQMRHEESIYGGLFSNDDTKVLTWSKDGTAKLWNAASGTMIGEQMRHDRSVIRTLVNRDGDRILTISENYNYDAVADGYRDVVNVAIKIWNTTDRKNIGNTITANLLRKNRYYCSKDEYFPGSIFNADGSQVITLSGSTIRRWSTDDGTAIGNPIWAESKIIGILFNKDITKVLAWSEDNVARIWNIDSGTLIGEPMRHEASIHGAIFNKDETRILTWSGDGTAKLWNADGGTMIGESMQHDQYYIDEAIFNKEESRILTWRDGAGGKLWNIEVDYDFPKEYLPLFVEVATETTLDDSGNVRSLKSSELKERRKEYIRINEDHLKTCKYKHVNFYLQHQKPAWNIP